MYCSVAAPSLRRVPFSVTTAGTFPLGFTARKSSPVAVIFLDAAVKIRGERAREVGVEGVALEGRGCVKGGGG
jgi:hypothetical protein